MNKLQHALDARGIEYKEAIKKVPYHSLYKHLHGTRSVGTKSALLYEKVFGIPRSELRPDLWPPEVERAKEVS